MKIFITGGGGQVAYDLKRIVMPAKADIQSSSTQYQVYAPNHADVSISDFNSLKSAITTFNPDIVINTAAYTQVDRAEQEKELALATNFQGAKNLADICEQLQVPLIHLSTDYVFDGNANKPYSESDSVSPINFYGETKWRAEDYIQQQCEKHIILRVSAVFGLHGTNFAKTILRLAKERDELRVVADQTSCPTSAASIAEIVMTLCENPKWGLFHYCGSPAVTWYDFAKSIIETASTYEKLRITNLHAITTAEYPTPAKRPKYSVLNCEKIQTIYNIQQPNWKTGLHDVIKQLYSS